MPPPPHRRPEETPPTTLTHAATQHTSHLFPALLSSAFHKARALFWLGWTQSWYGGVSVDITFSHEKHQGPPPPTSTEWSKCSSQRQGVTDSGGKVLRVAGLHRLQTAVNSHTDIDTVFICVRVCLAPLNRNYHNVNFRLFHWSRAFIEQLKPLFLLLVTVCLGKSALCVLKLFYYQNISDDAVAWFYQSLNT